MKCTIGVGWKKNHWVYRPVQDCHVVIVHVHFLVSILRRPCLSPGRVCDLHVPKVFRAAWRCKSPLKPCPIGRATRAGMLLWLPTPLTLPLTSGSRAAFRFPSGSRGFTWAREFPYQPLVSTSSRCMGPLISRFQFKGHRKTGQALWCAISRGSGWC